jgi:hypothetical protein
MTDGRLSLSEVGTGSRLYAWFRFETVISGLPTALVVSATVSPLP